MEISKNGGIRQPQENVGFIRIGKMYRSRKKNVSGHVEPIDTSSKRVEKI
jgi:hypothetical protein